MHGWKSLGFGVFQVAGLPFNDAVQPTFKKKAVRQELLEPLRAVQKPERLAKFDSAENGRAVVSQCCDQGPLKRERKLKREQEEPEGQTKL